MKIASVLGQNSEWKWQNEWILIIAWYIDQQELVHQTMLQRYSEFIILCVCVFRVYFTTRFLSWPRWRKLITNVFRLWMVLWNSVIFLTRDSLLTWNWQLFSCSKIFSSLKNCRTFLLFTFELTVWVSLYCDAAQKMRPTPIMWFGWVFNMTNIIMMLCVVRELWILNA